MWIRLSARTITRLSDALTAPDDANVGPLGWIANEYSDDVTLNDDGSAAPAAA